MKKTNSKILILTLILISIIPLSIELFPTRNQALERSKIFNAETPQLSFETYWEPNGTAICTASEDQWISYICSDGEGGAIITWIDDRGSDLDIYAQRVDSNGTVIWTTNGVPICTASNDQRISDICSDGIGGAIIVWEDDRSGPSKVYAQRVDSNGTVLWPTNGVAISTEIDTQENPQVCSDGTGSAIITWQSGFEDIYAQKVDSTGTVLWTADGVPICTAINIQRYPKLCFDGVGGAIITWQDYRSGPGEIYAQGVDSNGNVLWMANGTAICTVCSTQWPSHICSDGLGGAIITWQDYRSGPSNVYAQRIDSDGNVQWINEGIAICTVRNLIMEAGPNIQICSDGIGGAIIAWIDFRSNSTTDIYAQRVDSTGNVQWAINGVPISIASGILPFFLPKICSDGSEGAFVTWTVFAPGPDYDIYAQHVDSTGKVQWASKGELISMANDIQSIGDICSNGVGGAIITWYDNRSGNFDIYAQHIKDTPSNGDGDGAIPFGNYYLLFIIFSILSLIIIIKRRIFHKSKL